VGRGSTAADAPISKIPDFLQIPETVRELLHHSVDEGTLMMVATGLAIFVVICLLLSMVETPPAIGK
jgi:hypothetical protein